MKIEDNYKVNIKNPDVLKNEECDPISLQKPSFVNANKLDTILSAHSIKIGNKVIDKAFINTTMDNALSYLQSKSIGETDTKSLISDMALAMTYYKTSLDRSMEQTVEEKQKEVTNKLDAIYKSTDTNLRGSINSVVEKVQSWLTDVHAEKFSKLNESNENAKVIKELIETFIYENKLSVHDVSQQELITYVKNRITGLDILDDAVYRREDIDEIQVDDYNDIYYIIHGKREDANIQLSSAEDFRYLVASILRTAGQVGKPESLSETTCFLRTRLGETSRVTILAAPIAIRPQGVAKHGSPYYQIVIRKQKADKLTVEKLIKLGSMSEYSAYLLTLGVRCGISMLFYGGTGTGKSAGMGAVLTAIPKDRRTISMAEIEELNLRAIDFREYIMVDGKKIKNTRYKRPYNSVLQWEFQTLDRELIKGKPGFLGGVNAALTMTPDCIIIQEAKGGEVKELSNAALSGHQSFTSVHASNVNTLKTRYLLMYQESGVNIRDELILQQLPLSFQWLVGFMQYPGGFRANSDITEITGYDTVTNELTENILVRYVVSSITRDTIQKPTGEYEDIYHIVGTHYAINKPTANSIEIMRNHGFLDDDIREFKRMWGSPRTPHMDETTLKNYYSKLIQ